MISLVQAISPISFLWAFVKKSYFLCFISLFLGLLHSLCPYIVRSSKCFMLLLEQAFDVSVVHFDHL
jgi:hypothetical protein